MFVVEIPGPWGLSIGYDSTFMFAQYQFLRERVYSIYSIYGYRDPQARNHRNCAPLSYFAPLVTPRLSPGALDIHARGRSRMAIDPLTPTMPGRSSSGFHQPREGVIWGAFLCSGSGSLVRAAPLSFCGPFSFPCCFNFEIGIRNGMVNAMLRQENRLEVFRHREVQIQSHLCEWLRPGS